MVSRGTSPQMAENEERTRIMNHGNPVQVGGTFGECPGALPLSADADVGDGVVTDEYLQRLRKFDENNREIVSLLSRGSVNTSGMDPLEVRRLSDCLLDSLPMPAPKSKHWLNVRGSALSEASRRALRSDPSSCWSFDYYGGGLRAQTVTIEAQSRKSVWGVFFKGIGWVDAQHFADVVARGVCVGRRTPQFTIKKGVIADRCGGLQMISGEWASTVLFALNVRLNSNFCGDRKAEKTKKRDLEREERRREKYDNVDVQSFAVGSSGWFDITIDLTRIALAGVSSVIEEGIPREFTESMLWALSRGVAIKSSIENRGIIGLLAEIASVACELKLDRRFLDSVFDINDNTTEILDSDVCLKIKKKLDDMDIDDEYTVHIDGFTSVGEWTAFDKLWTSNVFCAPVGMSWFHNSAARATSWLQFAAAFQGGLHKLRPIFPPRIGGSEDDIKECVMKDDFDLLDLLTLSAGVSAQTFVGGLGAKALKAIVAAIVGLGLVKTFKGALAPASVFALTTQSMKEGFSGVIELATSVVNSLMAFDGAAAFAAVRSYVIGEEGAELDEILEKFTKTKNDKSVCAMKRILLLKKIKNELLDKEKMFKVTGRDDFAQLTRGFIKSVESEVSECEKARARAELKVQPLLLIGDGLARSGKSTIPIAIAAALASVYDMDTQAALEMRFVPATGSAYMEGYDGHIHIHVDEMNSIDPNINTSLGEQMGNLLDWVSTVTSSMNMAFESKGKVDSSALRVVSANTNSTRDNLLKHFSQPIALLGRAHFVRVIPDESVVRDRVFVPTLIEYQGPIAVASKLRYVVEKGSAADPHTPPVYKEVGNFSYEGFVAWIASQLRRAESGDVAQVRDDFTGLADVRVDENGAARWPSERVAVHKEARPREKAPKRVFVRSKVPHATPETDKLVGQIRKEMSAKMTAAIAGKVGRKFEFDPLAILSEHAAARVGTVTDVEAQMFSRRWKAAKESAWRFGKALPFTSCYSDAVVRTTDVVLERVALRVEQGWGVIRAQLKKVVAVLAALGAVYASYALYQSVSERRSHVEAQVLTAPKPWVPSDKSSVDPTLAAYLGDLYEVRPSGVRPEQVFLAGPTTVAPSALESIERNMVSVVFRNLKNGAEIPGERASGQVFGVMVNGVVACPRHILQLSADELEVRVSSAALPRADTIVRLRVRDICQSEITDLLLLPNFHPRGVRDVGSNMRSGGVERGDTVYLLGAGSCSRAVGVVTTAGMDLKYKVGDNVMVVQRAFEYVLDGTTTVPGDCGRILIAQGRHGLVVAGMHVGVRSDATNKCLAAVWDPNEVRRILAGPTKVVAQAGLSSPDLVTVGPLHVKFEDPALAKVRRGVMADPDAWCSRNLPIIGVGNQTRPGKSSLVPSSSHEVASAELRKDGLSYAPAHLAPAWRWDTEAGYNRPVNQFEAGLDYSDIEPGSPRLDLLVDVVEGVVSVCEPLLAGKRAGPVRVDAALEAIGELKPVNGATGAALPVPGLHGNKKKDYMVVAHVDGHDYAMAHDELRRLTAELAASLLRGEVPMGAGTLNPKDEVVKSAKVDTVNTRLINCVSFEELLLNRQMLGEALSVIYPVLQSVFGMCFRVNAIGPDWAWIHKRVLRAVNKVGLGADFKRYDKHHLYVALWIALEILYRLVCKVWTGPLPLLVIVRGLLIMVLRRVVFVDGVWIFAFLGGPSGHLLTVYFNCMCQLVYWWLVYRETDFGRDKTFQDFMRDLVSSWCSLGDDCLLCLPREFAIQVDPGQLVTLMHRVCGQELTGSGSKGVLKYDGELDFLKRGFRVVGERVFSPLPAHVVFKAFLYEDGKLDSGASRRRMQQLLMTMWDESHMMGEPDQSRVRGFLREVSRVSGIAFESSTYDEFLVKFDNDGFATWQTSVVPQARTGMGFKEYRRPGGDGLGEPYHRASEVPSRDRGVCNIDRFQNVVAPDHGRLLHGRAGLFGLTPRGQDSRRAWSPDGGGFRPADMMKNSTILPPPTVVDTTGVVTTTHPDSEVYDTSGTDATLPVVAVRPERVGAPVPIEMGTLAPHDPVFDRMYTVLSLTWTNGSASIVSNNIFSSYWNVPAVKQRFELWGNVRFDLEVRIEMASNPYAAGLMRVYWKPLETLRNTGWTAGGFLSQCGTAVSALGVDLDPSTPGPKTLVLPWCHPEAFLRTTESNNVLLQMGVLEFLPIVPLYMVNAKTGDLQLTVRARAINFRRAAPTYTAVTAQSGPIAKGAKAVGTVADALAAVPPLASMARAAGTVARAVYSIADYFGWSREEAKGYTAVITRPVAYTAVADLDSTLYVGPERGGLYGDPSWLSATNEDQMSVDFIVHRIGYLGRLQWSSSAATNTVLLEHQVSPNGCVAGAATGVGEYAPGDLICPTPLAFGSYPFGAWRGTIIYTFKVVCSNYHAGTLRISYNPSPLATSGSQPTAMQFDSMENCILEIKPGASLDLAVGYQEPTGWCLNMDTFYPFTSTNPRGWQNGRIFVSVVNTLTAPVATDPAYLLIYARAGPDYELAMPRDLPREYAVDTTPPAFRELDAVEAQAAFVTNQSAVARCGVGVTEERPGVLEDHVLGKSIKSYRALLHRYTYVGVLNSMAMLVGTNVPKTARWTNVLHETCWSGPISVTLNTAPNTSSFQASGPSLFRWLKLVYTGHRGGAHWRLRVWNRSTATETPQLPDYKVIAGYSFDTAIGTTANSEAMVPARVSPVEIVSEHNNEVCDVHIPDTSVYAITPGGGFRPTNYSGYPLWQLSITRRTNDPSEWYYVASKACAEDFSFLGFSYIPSFVV